MEIRVKYKNLDDYIIKWCKVLDKYFPMSNKELNIVTYIIKKQIEYDTRSISKDEQNQLLLSSSMRKDILKVLNMTQSSLNFYISTLREKQVLIGNTVHPKLIPNESLTFTFVQNEQKVQA